MGSLGGRPTADVVVLILTGVVGFIVTVVAMVAVGGLVTGHAADVKDLITTVGQMISGLISVIVGYVAGRGVSGTADTSRTIELPGEHKGPPE